MEDHAPVNRRLPALLWLTAATFVWGFSFPLIKALHLQHAGQVSAEFISCSLLGLRFLLAGVVLLAFRPSLVKKIAALEWKQAAWLSAGAGPGLILQAVGLSSTDASVSAFLTQFYCVLLPLWVCLRGRKLPTSRILLATALVLVGVGKLSGITWEKLHLGLGEGLTLLSTLFFTFQILVLDNVSYKDNRSGTVTLLMFFFLGIMGLLASLPTMQSLADWSHAWAQPGSWAILAVITLGCTLFSFLCMNRWQPYVSSVEAGLIYCLEPVSTAILSLFLPVMLSAWLGIAYGNEILTAGLVFGGSLILLANIVLLMPTKAATEHP